MRKLILIIAIVFMAITAQAQLEIQPDLSANETWIETKTCILDRYGLACVELETGTPMDTNDEIRIYQAWKTIVFVKVIDSSVVFITDKYGNEVVNKEDAVQAVYGERIASTVKDTIYFYDKIANEKGMIIEDREIIESDGKIVGYELKPDYFFDHSDGEFKRQGFSDQTISLFNKLKKVDDKYYIVDL